MPTDIGNLALGLKISGLDALTQLENRLNALDKAFGAPMKIAVDPSAANGGIQAIKQLGDTYNQTTQTIVNNVKTLTAAEMAHQQAMQQGAQVARSALQAQQAASAQQLQAQRATDQQVLAQQRATVQQQQQVQRAADAQNLQAQRAADQQRLQQQRATDQQQLAQIRAAQQQAAAQQRASSGGGITSFAGVGSLTGQFAGLAATGPAAVPLLAADAIATGLTDATRAALGFNSTIEQATLRFTALTGSADQARQMVAQINQIAASSVFGAPQLQQAASQLLAYGADVSSIIPQIKAVATASAAAGGDLNDNFSRISYVISELNSGIPLSERQIRQLGMAGVPIKALADQLGVTVEQLANAGKTGQVTSAQLVDAFTKVYTQGKYGDFIKLQTETLSGSLSLVRTNITQLLGTALEPLFALVRNVAVRLGELAQSGQLQAWARQAQQVVGALVGTFQQLLSVIGTVAQGVASVFGVTLPRFSLTPQAAGAPGQQDQIAKAAGATNDLTTKTQAWNAALSTAADANLARIKEQIDAIRDAQGDLTDRIAAVKQGYEDQIAPLQRQLDVVNQLSQAEKDRQARLDELTGKEIQIKLAMPDVSGIDKQISDLKDKKDALGKFDPTDYDNLIRPLQQQSDAYSKAIEGLQERLRDLAKPSTDAIDAQIKALQTGIDNLNTRAIDRQIEDLRNKLNAPPPDVTNLQNQMVALAAGMATNPAERAALAAQYGALSRQRTDILTADQASRAGAQSTLTQLEAQRTTMQRQQEDQRTADEKRIKDLQAQKQGIEDAYQAQRDGIQRQITDQERLKRTVDEQAKVWTNARQEAEKAFQANLQGIDDQIAHLTRQKDDLLAPSKAALAQIDAERTILTLQQQQDDLKRKQAAEPIKAQIDALKQAEQDALAPLQKQQAALESQTRELDKQQRYWQSIADGIKKANDAAKGKTDAQSGGAPVDDSRWGGFGTGAAPQASALADAIDNLNTKLREFNDWWGNNITPALKTAHDVIANDVLPRLADLGDWLRDTGIPKLQELSNWLNAQVVPIFKDWKQPIQDVVAVLGDLSKIAGYQLAQIDLPALKLAIQALELQIDTVLMPALRLWSDIMSGAIHLALTDLHDILSGTMPPTLTNFAAIVADPVVKTLDGFATMLGDDGLIGALGRLKTWVEQNWKSVGTVLASPFTDAWDKIKGFFNDLYTGIDWLAGHFGLPSISAPPLGNLATVPTGGAPPVGGAPGALATGAVNWPGGPAVVGEAGRELVHRGGGLTGRAKGPGEWELVNQASLIHLPKGSTVIPNRITERLLAAGVPGFAGGLNIGSVFDALGGVVAGSAGRFVDALMGGLPAISVPGLPGAAGALTKQIGEGLLKWLANAPGNLVKNVVSGVTGALTGGVNLPGMVQPTGQWAAVVQDAMQHVGETWSSAHQHVWDGWCEQFVNDMDVAAGFGARRHNTAYEHAIDTTLYGGPPPAGASIYFDKSWSWAGHTAVATGNGNQAISTPIGGLNAVGFANIVGVPGYMGWAPPGLANGGISYGGQPRIVMVGDGPPGQKEFHAPEPDLRQLVREEAGGVTFTGDIVINLSGNSSDPQGQGQAAARGFIEEMQARGHNWR